MNKEYIFISKPRCASTHIYEGLTNWDDKINGNKPYYHFSSEKMLNIFKNDFKQKFSFSVVRHPYDLVLSWYNEHRKNRYEKSTKKFYNITLEKWINNGCPTHWKKFKYNPLHQYKWVCNDNDEVIVSYILKLENYNEDIKYVYEKIKTHLPKNVTIKTIQNTRKNDSLNTHILTESQKEKIYKLFQKDFELFGYSK